MNAKKSPLFPIYREGVQKLCDERCWPTFEADGWSKSKDEAPAPDPDPADASDDSPSSESDSDESSADSGDADLT